MHDVTSFGGVVLVWGLVGTAALLARRVARWVGIPAPAVFLLAAAVAANYIKSLRTAVDLHIVENVVTLALIVILFDGGCISDDGDSVKPQSRSSPSACSAPSPRLP